MQFNERDVNSLLDYAQAFYNLTQKKDPTHLTEATMLVELYELEDLAGKLRDQLEKHLDVPLESAPEFHEKQFELESETAAQIAERNALRGFGKAARQVFDLVKPGETVAPQTVWERAQAQHGPFWSTRPAVTGALYRLAKTGALIRDPDHHTYHRRGPKEN